MARINNRRVQSDSNTGFGVNSGDNSGRFYNANGVPNVKKKGIGFFEGISWFHTLINMRSIQFFSWLLIGFIVINLGFTCLYLLIGVDHLSGIRPGIAHEIFMEVFFFSAQTLTTVGYGRISPIGNLAGLVSTFEAFTGLLSFALASGLFFARFSRPFMHVRFSKNMVIAPFKEGTALMFRFAPTKNNIVSEVEIKILLAIQDNENGRQINRFYPLETTISKINTLVLSWTIVHELNEESPLYGFDANDFKETPFEIIIFVKAFDETHANQVIKRQSYVSSDIVYGAKFVTMYHPDPYDKV
jgi:inward rectifier potassium channel